jgi:hypothetical protein
MTKLYGWASYMAPFLDHAYVTSSKGHAWPCWGGAEDGREICSGPGDAGVADCISEPDSEAGIEYGLTGACHQTANRILWPAGVTVSKAGGHALSALLWGVYGTPTQAAEREWRERIARCSGSPAVNAASNPASGKEEKEYMEKLIGLHLQTVERGPLEILAQETELLIGYRLPGAGRILIEKVKSVQKELLVRKEALDQVLLSRSVGGGQYALEVNSLIHKALEQCLRFLKPDQFERLFGLKPGARCDVVVPEIAAKYYG